MIETARHIRFVLTDTPGRKTAVWLIQTVDGMTDLGEVKFNGGWRCYAFFPLPKTLYERECLRDIADFCERKTGEWQQEVRDRRGNAKTNTKTGN